jgi:two-component system nitrate/nitrite response regulator NarL
VLRAVLVEDSADLRMLTRFTLEDGCCAEIIGEACDGLDGLDMIEALQPDVAIIDLHIPGLNGVQLIECLRSRSATTRLVAYSSDDVALRDALAAGADAAVLKTGFSGPLLSAVAS